MTSNTHISAGSPSPRKCRTSRNLYCHLSLIFPAHRVRIARFLGWKVWCFFQGSGPLTGTMYFQICPFRLADLWFNFPFFFKSVQELDELHIKKRDIKSNFTKEQRRYYSNVKEIRAQKQKEDYDKRNKDRFSSLKDAHV